MKATRLAIPDVVMLEPQVFSDPRGAFFESFNARSFADLVGYLPEFVQDNHSISARGVLRGLHFQLPPLAQGKLVRVVRGEAFDVAVDIRPGSPSFGRWVAEMLSADNRKQLWIPEGFAHGFMALRDDTEFLYKTTRFYDPASERCITWNDPTVAVQWPKGLTPQLSPKDEQGRSLRALFPAYEPV